MEAAGAEKALRQICAQQKEGERLKNCRTVADDTSRGLHGWTGLVETPEQAAGP